MNETWPDIERAARVQAASALAALEAQPLVIGGLVAWADCHYGKTDALSVVHRIAVADGKVPETFCGEPIPAPVRRLDLTVWPVRRMDRCRWCDVGYAQSARQGAA